MKHRILFVDDEPNVLKELQQSLRNMRSEWDMKFVQDGPEAIEVLEAEHVDIIITDMRMPEMDGATLLRIVKSRFPDVIRMILSGQSDKESFLKSSHLAHQFLSKPCDVDVLTSTIHRAIALKNLLTDETFKCIVYQIDSLPSLPALYNAIICELQSETSSIKKIGDIIAQDPSMAAKILQLINSAYYGLPRHIVDPVQAVNLLGLNIIKALVLTIEIFAKFETSQIPESEIKKLYTHALNTGRIARMIAKNKSRDKQIAENAFMAGLLHDIGKLLFAAKFSGQFKHTVKLMQQDHISFEKAEKLIWDVTHCQAGAYLLAFWGLPNVIVEAVAFHHRPWDCCSSEFGPLSCVYTADIIDQWAHRDRHTQDVMLIEHFNSEYLRDMGLEDRSDAWAKYIERK